MQLQREGVMHDASIGNNLIKDDLQLLRSDKIYWLDKSHDNVFEQQFLSYIDAFVHYLNETCYAGIQAVEFHYAVYEKEKAYQKHRDQFKNDDKRQFSLVCYLNKHWKTIDDGELWLHHATAEQKIIPTHQSSVFFKSDTMHHEVCIANRDRMSITGWLKRG